MDREWFDTAWCQKPLRDKVKTAIMWLVLGLVGLAMAAGILWFLALVADAEDYRSIEHPQCLKDATNGLEIERCR